MRDDGVYYIIGAYHQGAIKTQDVVSLYEFCGYYSLIVSIVVEKVGNSAKHRIKCYRKHPRVIFVH